MENKRLLIILFWGLLLSMFFASSFAYAQGWKYDSSWDWDSLFPANKEPQGRKCYDSSECGGGKCRSHKCSNAFDGMCYSDNDCAGSKCNSHKCVSAKGHCYYDRDCGPGVKCFNGVCSTALGGHCYYESDCGGGKCRARICSNSPDGKCNNDSECAGRKCREHKCVASGGRRPSEPEQKQLNDKPSPHIISSVENNPDSNDKDSAIVQMDSEGDNYSFRQMPKIVGMDSSESNEFYCVATLKYLDDEVFVTKRKIYKNVKNDAVNKLLKKGCMKFCDSATDTVARQNCINDCQQKAFFESSINCLSSSTNSKNSINVF